jgi:enolase
MSKSFKIKKIKAREILDSRGSPTVEVELFSDRGNFFASVPSGASVGKYEAPTIRIKQAIKNINEIISPALKGKDFQKQKEIDDFLDPVKFGANVTTGVSMVICRASAAAQKLPLYEYIKKYAKITNIKLPKPAFNIINGGAHAGNNLDFQEFMIVPEFKEFSKNLQAGSEIYHLLKKILKRDFGKNAINVGDEGGFAPNLSTAEQALDLIMKAIKTSGYQNKIKIAIDVAASEFYKNGKYSQKSRTEMIEYYLKLIKKYPIISIEDPFEQDDFQGWEMLKSKVKSQKSKIIIIGDDLLVTNIERIKMAKEKNLCNGLLLKINQIGTISKALEAAKLARSYNWKIMVSHRSGETNDDFIADLAVGIGADYIKSGAPARGERVAKYNRLLKIENERFNQKNYS